MNIEKLGITKKWMVKKHVENTIGIGGISIGRAWERQDDYLDISEEDEKLISAAPEMLEYLIEDVLFQEKVAFGEIEKFYQDMIIIIEKATGKKWPEIKELIK